MRFFHISDLHIGKQMYFYNLKKNQEHILKQIVEKAREYEPEAILIAGDIFDKSIPSGEAYDLFDEFLNGLADLVPQIPVLIIAGNHDSAERLNYASSFLEKHRIHIATLPPKNQEEYLKKVVLEDDYGPVNFYLLPFTKPGYVRGLFEDGANITYDMAIEKVIEREEINEQERNVILSHQFYVNHGESPETCQSELAHMNVGGLDDVEAKHLKKFDYGALGHIHGAQKVGEEYIRYSGTPLKYSVSERNHKKEITLVELKEKGAKAVIEHIPLEPMQNVRQEMGTLQEVIGRATKENKNDFLSIVLTDEEEIFNPKEKLEEYYPYILEIRVDNTRTRQRMELEEGEMTSLDPFEAFVEFYEEMNQTPMNEEEKRMLQEVILQVGGEQE